MTTALFWFFMMLNLALGIFGLVMDHTQPIGFINIGVFFYMLRLWAKR